MTDLYLHFASQADMINILSAMGMTYKDDDGTEHLVSGSHDYAAWEVGEIQGTEGWHLNLRMINPSFDVSALEAYKVFPRQPRVVWA